MSSVAPVARLDFLDAHRAAIPTLAAWHHAEWGGLYDHWTLDVCRAELEDHAARRTLPTTLVLLDDDAGALLGSVSLVLEDAPEFADEGSPWLASLYVRADARGVGHGATLVRAAVAHAASLCIGELFLFTPRHRAFYERLGWRSLVRTVLKGTPVDLMCIAPAEATAPRADTPRTTSAGARTGWPA